MNPRKADHTAALKAAWAVAHAAAWKAYWAANVRAWDATDAYLDAYRDK